MKTRLLADENFPWPVIAGLCDQGHDVLSVARSMPGITDLVVLTEARCHGRWLLTFDSDFGDLVFFHGAPPPPAILYFRLHPIAIDEVLAVALRAISEVQTGYFAVLTRENTRLRPFPIT